MKRPAAKRDCHPYLRRVYCMPSGSCLLIVCNCLNVVLCRAVYVNRPLDLYNLALFPLKSGLAGNFHITGPLLRFSEVKDLYQRKMCRGAKRVHMCPRHHLFPSTLEMFLASLEPNTDSVSLFSWRVSYVVQCTIQDKFHDFNEVVFNAKLVLY